MRNLLYRVHQEPYRPHWPAKVAPTPKNGGVTIVEGLLGYSREELREGFEDGTFWPTKRTRFPYMEEMLQ